MQNTGLNGGTHGHDLIGVHAGVGLGTEELFHDFANLGHAGHAADQDHFVNAALVDAGIGQCFLARLQRALDQIADKLLQLGTADRLDEVQRGGRTTFHACSDEGQVHFSGLRTGKLDLGLLGRFLQALKSELVGLQVHVFLRFELLG